MKNKFIVAIMAVMLFGCSEQLERNPIDALGSDVAFSTVGDLENGMFGFVGNYNPNLTLAFNSIFADNVKLGLNNGGQELNTLNQILNADGGDRGIWASRYGLINDINRILEAASTITPATTEETELYNYVLGQCYAFRALAHYDILLYYSFDITDPSAEGVVYQDFVAIDGLPSRNTVGEVLTGIQGDLTLANDLLQGESDINFATPDFITFLRARIALETGDYPGAINFSSQLITSGNYPLANQAQYFDMFRDDANTQEVIWKYDNVQGFNYNAAGIWNFTATGTLSDAGFIEMSNQLLDLLDAADIRRAVNLDPVSALDDGEILIGKYGPNADTQFINDVKFMRISEMYLLRAEAYARNQQLGLAADDVEAIRDQRLAAGAPTPVYDNTADAIEDIIAERRLELAFEGHRYIDIKRVRDILNVGIVRGEDDCGGAVPCELAPDSEKWIFPVPTAEVNANPNILPQAPGYGG